MSVVAGLFEGRERSGFARGDLLGSGRRVQDPVIYPNRGRRVSAGF